MSPLPSLRRAVVRIMLTGSMTNDWNIPGCSLHSGCVVNAVLLRIIIVGGSACGGTEGIEVQLSIGLTACRNFKQLGIAVAQQALSLE